MSKYTFWTLILFMTLTLNGLVLLEIFSIANVTNMLQEEFTDGVHRALYRTAVDIEEQEVKHYLDKALSDSIEVTKIDMSEHNNADQGQRTQLNMFLSKSDSILTPEGNTAFLKLGNQVNSSIEEVSRVYSDKYKKRFLRSRSLLDIITVRLINEAPDLPIEERVDFKQLYSIIERNFRNNGIELKFHFAVVDKFNRIAYSHKDRSIDMSIRSYNQLLFPSICGKNEYYIYLYFYDEQDYYKEAMQLSIPFVALTTLLIATFILTLYYIFRQRKLNEMKNDFINNMTHELKTPVSSISLSAQMLNDLGLSLTPESIRRHSKILLDETKRLTMQVDKVLQVSLFDREKTMLSVRDVNVNDMIQTITANFSLKVSATNGQLKTQLTATNSLVSGDEMHLGNVIYNLMDNAVKYSKETEPTILNITTWNTSKRLYISVEDNGIGIKKEYLKNLFEKFYRVPTGNRHDVKGFGLGLNYVRKIVLLHKGHIKVESELNVGTKFIIDIPLITG